MSTPHAPPDRVKEKRSTREVDAFCVQFAPRAPGHPAVRDLQRLLSELPAQGLEARLEWVERLVSWLKEPRPVHGLVEADEPEAPAASTRLGLLARVLEEREKLRESLGALVREVVNGTSGLRLFAQVGLPAGQGFLGEAVDRLTRHVLPSPPEHHQLSELLLRLFPEPGDAAWLESLPPELLARLTALLGGARPPEPAPEETVRTSQVDALVLLSAQVASLGLAEDVRERCPEVAFRASPFLRLRRVCDSVLARGAAPDSLRELQDGVEECRQVVEIVSGHLEQYGVSVDLVYRLERIRRGLERMDALGRVLRTAPGEERWREGLGLVGELLRQAHEDRSVRAVVGRNVRLLARKVIERAGQSGEHYITATRRDFHNMVHSAVGGGLVMALTAALEMYTGGLALPLFFQGLVYASNYVGTFLLMQVLGFTLATKQPSMAAATLASAIGQEGPEGPEGRLKHLVELIPRITRSQLAAALGNLGAALLAALGLAMAFPLVLQRPLLSEETAREVVASLHPWHSGTVPYAALTGLLLWVSSLVAGWLENWAVFRRLPEGLAHHRVLRRVLGEAGAKRLGELFGRHIAAVGGNVSLGMLLALPVVAGAFFGLPLDVRHVTLSFGQLSLAGYTLGPEAVLRPDFLAALGGVALTLAMNFGVSFSLAMGVALRARDVPTADVLGLVKMTVVRFIASPRSFLLPPREQPGEPVPPTFVPLPLREGRGEGVPEDPELPQRSTGENRNPSP